MMCTFLSEHILCSSLSPDCVENKILGTYRYSNEGSMRLFLVFLTLQI
jgi:hypothetical protein